MVASFVVAGGDRADRPPGMVPDFPIGLARKPGSGPPHGAVLRRRRRRETLAAVAGMVGWHPEGDGLAPAVLFHGFGDSPECWSPLIAAIDEDVVVMTPAAPGHAGERLPPQQALDLPFLTDVALAHVTAAVARAGRPVVVGGHSMGAATAVAVAARRPDLVAGVFLEDPPWWWPPHDGPDPTVQAKTDEYRDWIAGLQASSHEDRVQWCLDHNPGWPADEYDIWARAKAEIDPAVFDRPIDLGRFSWQPAVQAVRCPATIVVGRWDLGSACMPEVVELLEVRDHWRTVRLDVGHDVRRQARPVVAREFVDLLRRTS
jgi:pimeloyl-ACP methyl ester carboxylesterase